MNIYGHYKYLWHDELSMGWYIVVVEFSPCHGCNDPMRMYYPHGISLYPEKWVAHGWHATHGPARSRSMPFGLTVGWTSTLNRKTLLSPCNKAQWKLLSMLSRTGVLWFLPGPTHERRRREKGKKETLSSQCNTSCCVCDPVSYICKQSYPENW